MPNTKTGPATVNILAPSPVINPSLLNSMAGDTMEFAKPVIGTSVPAPATFAILSYQPNAVNTAEMYVEGYKASLVKDTSRKGLWTVSFTLREF